MHAPVDVEHTEDGRYVVIKGRRWRATDPDVPEEVAAVLRKELKLRGDQVAVLLGRDPEEIDPTG